MSTDPAEGNSRESGRLIPESNLGGIVESEAIAASLGEGSSTGLRELVVSVGISGIYRISGPCHHCC
jgi:hypothetical protein